MGAIAVAVIFTYALVWNLGALLVLVAAVVFAVACTCYSHRADRRENAELGIPGDKWVMWGG
jgi:asparagine N-glycosylation enzyme membrane subunit Stt3